ncbi:Fructose-1,6-bisphosphatase, chloroplastic [Porphyridium purpureum]|uniref:fructose-bisphosphatase n=1 Tax=Porphyridium purpureum TaxID=35688 RepID=A0A5J4YRB8_PORPP|nr:Fructose-1,6-bisphosphatase, chloroplastic [Porphyridium purpureum]|eukprot:POR8239..scf229_5
MQMAAFVGSAALGCGEVRARAASARTAPAAGRRTSRRAAAALSMVTSAKPSRKMSTETSPVTLTRFIIEEGMENADLIHLKDMENLMAAIALACKKISSLVARAGLSNLTGLEEGGGSINVQGEEQKKLDVLSNEVLKNALRFSGKMGIMASEEEDKPVLVDELTSGSYIAVFDPLDGSSNIDANIATGTIFGIFEDNAECLTQDWEDRIEERELQCMYGTMQPGTNLVASGYCLYSSACMLVLTFGNGVHGFTLDPTIGEFLLTHYDMKIPEDGKIYSFNEANEANWDPVMRDMLSRWKERGYSSRYIGSMVGDVHRTLMYGGIFGYPGDKKNKTGKLRLLYEAAPMSHIIEQAGGVSTTGTERIMDLNPQAVHQRVPVILGSKNLVNEVVEAYKQAK